jgi:hypothetical protein
MTYYQDHEDFTIFKEITTQLTTKEKTFIFFLIEHSFKVLSL